MLYELIKVMNQKDKFQKEVTEKLNQGYKPCGGVMVEHIHNNIGTQQGSHDTIFYQAVTKDENN